jgi:two-component system chemotaxis response regulator CheY
MQLWRLSVAKILIVDDSAMSRRILRSILEGAGHDVTEAEDGMIALEKYYLEKPDLVLLDLIMKGMLGMEVLRKIRLMDEGARVIVATADIQTSTQAMTEAEGAAAFVTKPFVGERILQTVNSVLEGQSNGSH